MYNLSAYVLCEGLRCKIKDGGTSVARRPPSRVLGNYPLSAKRMLGSDRKTSVNVIIGTCSDDPITAESCRAKTMSLLHASILFRPRLTTRYALREAGPFLLGLPDEALPWGERSQVEAPGTAPGSAVSILQGVYRHSRQADTLYIAQKRLIKRSLLFIKSFPAVTGQIR